MDALARLDGIEWWHVAGWTMLHFLWLGTIAGIAAGVCRLVLRRAPANVRYAVALVCLAVLAALPVGIAVWISAKPQAMQVATDSVNVPPMEIAPSAPGSAGGLTGALSAETPASVPAIVSHESATITNPIANPRQSRGLTDVIALVAGYLPWAWVVGTPLTFILLVTGVAGAERLRWTSRVIDDGPIADACARIVESLRIGRRVTIAVCERIASPVLVGIVRPIILLPPAALTGWSPVEIEMVLLHELAHVRRWDNLVNLIQRFVESLLFFHPAVWLVSSWVRSEREACCDAVVVGKTNQPHAYAEMLVALAAQMPRSVLFHPAASSAMAAGPLRGRIRRILGLQDDPMLISGKSLGVVMGGLLLVVTLVTLNLPLRGQAKEPTGGDRVDDIAEALDAFRKAVVGYDLDFDSVFPQTAIRPYNAKQLERYPTSDAWPDVLGHVDSDAGKFRTVSAAPRQKFETVTGGNAYLVPVDWSIGTKDYATLLLMRGLAADAHIVAHSYTSFASFGTLAGDVLFKSYATALVDGDMSGQITADSYFNLVVTGKFTGRIFTGSYAMIYLMGGFDGDMELENSKVFIAGRTPRAALKRIQGAGQVFLEESDLEGAENKIGELLVMVGKSFQPPAEVQMRQQIAQVEAINQLKNLALALHVYHDAKGALPAVASFDAEGHPLLSWRVHILPYLDGNATGGGTAAELYKEFHLDEPWDSEHNRKLIPRMPAVFRNPTSASSKGSGFTNYLAVVGPDCVFDGSARGIKFSEIPDGTSNTIMLAEAEQPVEWTKPDDFDFKPETPKAGLGTLGRNRWIAAFADGSIHAIAKDESEEKIREMFTRRSQDAVASLGKRLMVVPFVEGASRFAGGDSIKITEVRGTAGTMEPTNTYVIRGEYTLNSRDEATLSAFTTARDSKNGTGPVEKDQEASCRRGSGTFTLTLPMSVDGWPHVSFYPAGGGESFGGVYFGTGDSVLTKWWDSKFPSPEEQKWADIAWRRLGIEFAPLIKAFFKKQEKTLLEYVREKGYDGGVMVEILGEPRMEQKELQQYDILVGLDASPVTNMKDLADILSRSDLAESNPIKFYALRVARHSEDESKLEFAKVTGRIFVNLDAVSPYARSSTPAPATEPMNELEMQQMIASSRAGQLLTRADEMFIAVPDSAPARKARRETTPVAPVPKPELRYAGKTFDEWRTIWQTELSLERRLEVVKALAAFGASGRGKEAAQAILDVANQLDWTSVDFGAPSGKLKQGCIDAFTTGQSTEGYRIPVKDWWPLVVPIYENSPEKSTIVTYLAYQLPAGEKTLIPKLLELSNKDEATRNLALMGLKAVDPSLADDRVVARLRQSLKETDVSPAELRGAINNLLFSPSGNYSGGMGQDLQLRMVPELQPLLFHPDLEVRQVARFIITKAQPKDAAALAEYLIHILDTQSSGSQRREAIRALAGLGNRASPAEERLVAIAQDRDDPARFSAAAVLLRLWPDLENEPPNQRVKKLLGAKAGETLDWDDLDRKVHTEQQEIFGVYRQSTLGGGGGMF